ncbi:NmrA family protein [Actinomadura sp. NBRC 104412]|uniref:NmrA family NAD(P)-binding protein n=1 Tax=Actinomadura sp. NBRC 104412 TaxID=3032203 RepID=UPI0024A1822D|nr:NAD(P)H-binding protein [Actinomadura sp. NBRC 104412]GLZ09264.1 NmrA family protein [Actinomadura sp. NBRC 104412]
MTDTILVTGATGKTGRRLIPLLVRRGATVRAAGRRPGIARPGVEPVRFDWADESTYEAARKGVDAIYIVYGDPGATGDPAEQVATLLDGAAKAGVRRVVLLSALGVDGAPPDDPLRRVELAVESSGTPGTIVRPGAFMQNFSEPHSTRTDESIRERDEIVLPGGDGLVSWVSADDIAAVAAVALTEDGHEGKGYPVVGPERLTMAEVTTLISAAAGRPIRYVEAGRDRFSAMLVDSGMSREVAEAIGELYTNALATGAFGVLNDVVATVTGRPPISFAEFAAGAAAAWAPARTSSAPR